MKFNNKLLALALCFVAQLTIAQEKNYDALIKETSEGICMCVNKYTEGMDKDVQDLLIKVFEFEQNDDREGFQAYFKTVKEDVQKRMQEQMGILEKNKETYDACTEKNNKEMKVIAETDEALEKKLKQQVAGYLADKENCAFAAALTEVAIRKGK